jgi:hypothetical protein
MLVIIVSDRLTYSIIRNYFAMMPKMHIERASSVVTLPILLSRVSEMVHASLPCALIFEESHLSTLHKFYETSTKLLKKFLFLRVVIKNNFGNALAYPSNSTVDFNSTNCMEISRPIRSKSVCKVITWLFKRKLSM